MTEVYKLSENIYRVKSYIGKPCRETLLAKYRLVDLKPDGEPILISRSDDDTVSFSRGYTLDFALTPGEDGGFDIRLPLDASDRLYGLGDESRTSLEKHGKVAVMKQENVRSYGPVPYLMSSRGWAVMVLCTYAHTFDIAAETPDMLRIYGDKGGLDFIVITADKMRDTLYLAGKVTGRPVMLPKGGYGLTFVCNEQTTARTLLDDALRFKDRDIPCDILGLEPSWMDKHYDYSLNKKWNSARFDLPYWEKPGYYGTFSFIHNLHLMGKMLSLWLCCDYDLFWKEEGEAFEIEVKDNPDAEINDAHFKSGIRMDKTVKPGEDWFEHLKKFVDNGAEAFKLDGSNQVIPYPDRLWAGKYFDDEIRNMYPVVYAKQMKEGYADYTGKRAMINTCGTYLGTQKYAATWAGDTGCNLNVLLSIMNFAMCGHSNASFDMSSDSKEVIHIGFFAPWSQHLGWANYRYPWYSTDNIESCYRYYAQLRSKLFPYIYTFAHVANATSYPLMRPLSLVYDESDAYDEVYNEFMFGDSLLVSAFETNITLPEEDEWYDFVTGVKYDGPRKFDFELPELQGGAIFVKAGSIVVMQDHAKSLRESSPTKLYVHVYPGKDAEFELYEDDYETYAYEKGAYATTKFELCGDTLTIHPRVGGYDGMKPVTAFEVVYHNADGTTKSYDVSRESHESGVVTVELK